jgi:hypothetical protein
MPELNRNKLENVFDMESIETIESDISALPMADEDSADEIIKTNIVRANRILDTVEEEMDNGNFSARMVEVASKLIDSVTSAASQIQNNTYNNEYLLLREKLVELKRIETERKVSLATGGNTTNQNIIVTDRQSILDILNNKQLEEKENRYDE